MNNEQTEMNVNPEIEKNDEQKEETSSLFEIRTVKTGLKAARQGCCDGGSDGGGCGF